ncbi:MAG: esterase family protein [Nitrospira sp.]|nr:esterase family protein [Nitrospira sp.]
MGCHVGRMRWLVLASCLAGGLALEEQAAPAGSSSEWVTQAVSAPHLAQHRFYSAAAKAEVSVHVYVPEAYGADRARRFPAIYWLHGHGGGVKALPQVVAYFDHAMREGKIPPALVVFPNGMPESMWCNSKDGAVPMETVVIEEVVPYVDATWRTVASREGRLIEGFSMGGYGAARLGMKYPELFGAISMLGAGPMQMELTVAGGPRNLAADRARIFQSVYGGDQAYFRALGPWALAGQQADALRGRSLVRIAVGDQDAMQGPNQDFAAHLSNLHIPHTVHIVPQVAHQPLRLLQALGSANWDFYRAALDRPPTGNSIDASAARSLGR